MDMKNSKFTEKVKNILLHNYITFSEEVFEPNIAKALLRVNGSFEFYNHKAKQLYQFEALLVVKRDEDIWAISFCDILNCAWSLSSEGSNKRYTEFIIDYWSDCGIYNEACDRWVEDFWVANRVTSIARDSVSIVTELKKNFDYTLMMTGYDSDISVRNNIILYLTQLQSIMDEAATSKTRSVFNEVGRNEKQYDNVKITLNRS